MGAALAKGFADPVFEAQRAFRAVMDALARPATIQHFPVELDPPAPLTPELAAIALALADHDAPLWLDAPLATDGVAAFLRFHTGAAIVSEPEAAAFALVSAPAECPSFENFALGTQEYPDRSTTLVLAVDRLRDRLPSGEGRETGFVLRGPGIIDSAALSISPLPRAFAPQLAANRALFPRGVDLILAGPGCVAALPRTTALVGSA